MKRRTTIAALLAGVSLLGLTSGCGSAAETDSKNAAGAGARANLPGLAYYGQLALPSNKPNGIAAVRLEKFANPDTDGQRVQLVFSDGAGSNTVYVCSRPTSGQSADATKCPYPGKAVFRVIDSGAGVQTVYALDVQDAQTRAKGGSASARGVISAALKNANTEKAPGWFVQMAGQQAR